MAITKKYLKSKPLCKVTFKVEKELVKGAKSVSVLGEFNDWNPSANKLTKQKNGSFAKTIDLDKGKSYSFRYLIDDKKWINDPKADAYESNGISMEENCIISV